MEGHPRSMISHKNENGRCHELATEQNEDKGQHVCCVVFLYSMNQRDYVECFYGFHQKTPAKERIKDRVCLNQSCMFLCGGCVRFFGR